MSSEDVAGACGGGTEEMNVGGDGEVASGGGYVGLATGGGDYKVASGGGDEGVTPEGEDEGEYYAIHWPDRTETVPVGDLIFTTKHEAIQKLKIGKSTRFKKFTRKQDALNFVKFGDNTYHPSNEEKVPKPPPITHKEIIEFRKFVQCDNITAVKRLIDRSSEYLVATNGYPTILQEGARYNALHVAARSCATNVCEYILQTVSNVAFTRTWADPKEPDYNLELKTHNLVDAYLNMPDKVALDTPLIFACKAGALGVVRVLTMYTQCKLNYQNKEGFCASQVICSRAPDKAFLTEEILEALNPKTYFVPVFRSDDPTVAPKIGEPFPLNSPPPMVESRPIDMTSPLEIKAFAGPMTEQEATIFRKKWKTPERVRSSPRFELVDPEKGLEYRGRELARQFQVQWREYWPFWDSFDDIGSPHGLAKLELYLKTEYRKRADKRKEAVYKEHGIPVGYPPQGVRPWVSITNQIPELVTARIDGFICPILHRQSPQQYHFRIFGIRLADCLVNNAPLKFLNQLAMWHDYLLEQNSLPYKYDQQHMSRAHFRLAQTTAYCIIKSQQDSVALDFVIKPILRFERFSDIDYSVYVKSYPLKLFERSAECFCNAVLILLPPQSVVSLREFPFDWDAALTCSCIEETELADPVKEPSSCKRKIIFANPDKVRNPPCVGCNRKYGSDLLNIDHDSIDEDDDVYKDAEEFAWVFEDLRLPEDPEHTGEEEVDKDASLDTSLIERFNRLSLESGTSDSDTPRDEGGDAVGDDRFDDDDENDILPLKDDTDDESDDTEDGYYTAPSTPEFPGTPIKHLFDPGPEKFLFGAEATNLDRAVYDAIAEVYPHQISSVTHPYVKRWLTFVQEHALEEPINRWASPARKTGRPKRLFEDSHRPPQDMGEGGNVPNIPASGLADRLEELAIEIQTLEVMLSVLHHVYN